MESSNQVSVSNMVALYALILTWRYFADIMNVVKTIVNHPPNHHFYRWDVYGCLPFPVMAGLWHCFTHIVHSTNTWNGEASAFKGPGAHL